jgi:hypothetical protein
MNLDRVTITGADDSTPQSQLVRLSRRFPFVEWGILLSRSAEGRRSRFPSAWWVKALIEMDGRDEMKLSGHLCGAWVHDLCDGKRTFQFERPHFAMGFDRIQINFHAFAHTVDAPALGRALEAWDGADQWIFQLDGVNDRIIDDVKKTPSAGELDVAPLFDISGGAGILPITWPRPTQEYTGYAGGLAPWNLEEQLALIGAAAGEARIWIDVETHVRTADDQHFDLELVRRFLEIAEPHVVQP